MATAKYKTLTAASDEAPAKPGNAVCYIAEGDKLAITANHPDTFANITRYFTDVEKLTEAAAAKGQQPDPKEIAKLQQAMGPATLNELDKAGNCTPKDRLVMTISNIANSGLKFTP